LTVVGVARDAVHRQRLDLLDAAMGIPPGGLGPQRDVYLPYLQRPNPAVVLAIRTSDAGTALRSVREVVRGKDPTLPVYDAAFLDERLSRQDRGSRLLAFLAGAYALAALALAAVGLYGVVSHGAQQRTREIGIRRALGELSGSVLRRVVRDGLGMALAGCAAGLAGALVASRVLSSLLFGVAAADPEVLAGISTLLLAVSAVACWIPARRAARLDPVAALRA
jgi:ABC-type antimicrobial peptide transport system permease subunit